LVLSDKSRFPKGAAFVVALPSAFSCPKKYTIIKIYVLWLSEPQHSFFLSILKLIWVKKIELFPDFGEN
jgi:hypothetical protein